MKRAIDFQIGDRVKWRAGRVECKGVFLDNIDSEKCSIIMHSIGGRFSGKEQVVLKSVLQLDC